MTETTGPSSATAYEARTEARSEAWDLARVATVVEIPKEEAAVAVQMTEVAALQASLAAAEKKDG